MSDAMRRALRTHALLSKCIRVQFYICLSGWMLNVFRLCVRLVASCKSHLHRQIRRKEERKKTKWCFVHEHVVHAVCGHNEMLHSFDSQPVPLISRSLYIYIFRVCAVKVRLDSGLHQDVESMLNSDFRMEAETRRDNENVTFLR